jgi:hypothetical protein
MTAVERYEVVWDGRKIVFSWFPSPARPPFAGAYTESAPRRME